MKHDKNGRLRPKQASRDLPMKTFIENVPRAEFEQALELSPDPRFRQLFDGMTDPHLARMSFAGLCKQFSITLNDIHDLWRNHQLHKALIRMSTYTPEILEDIAIDARSKMQGCTHCNGSRVVTDTEGAVWPCPVCRGAGEVRVPGDKNARVLTYEALGLMKRGGPLVAIQQNFGLDAGLEEILGATQKLITEGDNE